MTGRKTPGHPNGVPTESPAAGPATPRRKRRRGIVIAFQPTDADPKNALRSAVQYLRNEAIRLGLPKVARALERAIALIDTRR
jgi:hypothetical protein